MADPHPIVTALRGALIDQEIVEDGVTDETTIVRALLRIEHQLKRIASAMP